ncbi:hypothetical protein [Amycolatopsis sp. ATCC 39116]|uniref:hypothetical protein n=1 Tax=Amycolatopsis sp. (strain ATCC 39116 / 75iv2) TaxID=385957 RepID=UPI0002625D01|nr:hypothetical protein [Amycolatopsis sp. ATCC 39116]
MAPRSEDLEALRHATISSVNAMCEALTDLRERLETGFSEIRGKLDAAVADQERIVGLLDQLIARQGGQSDTP